MSGGKRAPWLPALDRVDSGARTSARIGAGDDRASAEGRGPYRPATEPAADLASDRRRLTALARSPTGRSMTIPGVCARANRRPGIERRPYEQAA